MCPSHDFLIKRYKCGVRWTAHQVKGVSEIDTLCGECECGNDVGLVLNMYIVDAEQTQERRWMASRSNP